MPKVTVECATPNEMRLAVRAEMTIGEWREVLRLTKDVSYYAPASQLLRTIEKAIDAVVSREDVKYDVSAEPRINIELSKAG